MSIQLPPDLSTAAEEIVRGDAQLWQTLHDSGETEAGLLLNLRAAEKDVDTFGEKDYWGAVQRELHSFLCTGSAEYKGLRESLKVAESATSKILVPTLAGLVGKAVGLPYALALPFVALGLFGALKISVNAWCAVQTKK